MDLSIVGLESLSKQGYVQSEPKGPVIDSSICGGAPGRLGNMLKHSTVWRLQCLSNPNLRFALGYVLGRRALSRIFRPFESRIPVQAKFKTCSSVHSGTKGLSLMFRSVERSRSPEKYAQAFDGLEAPMLVQTKFKVCVGVRSGPKGPVIDLSFVGLESLSKQGYVQSEPKGRVIHSSICGGAPGRLGNMLKHSTVWRPQCLSNQKLRFALGYVLGRRALSWIFRPLVSNPCSRVGGGHLEAAPKS